MDITHRTEIPVQYFFKSASVLRQWGFQYSKTTNVVFPLSMTNIFVIWRIPLRFISETAKRVDFTVNSYTSSGFNAENDTSSELSDTTLNHKWIVIGS